MGMNRKRIDEESFGRRSGRRGPVTLVTARDKPGFRAQAQMNNATRYPGRAQTCPTVEKYMRSSPIAEGSRMVEHAQRQRGRRILTSTIIIVIVIGISIFIVGVFVLAIVIVIINFVIIIIIVIRNSSRISNQ